MSKKVLKDVEADMKKAEQNFVYELGGIRAGRANASLLDRVTVNYYGADTPLNQLAQISVPEARVLMISPYDKNSLGDIEKAIQIADLGIVPQNDGNVIRLTIPALTQERRKEIAKKIGEEQENAKIAVRNIRREGIDEIKKEEKAGDISEDEQRKFEKDIQKITDASVEAIDKLASEKEQEILNN